MTKNNFNQEKLTNFHVILKIPKLHANYMYILQDRK